MPKLPVPRKIVCGSHSYKVVLSRKASNRLSDEGNHGDVNHRTMEVRINLRRPDSQKTEALIHEAIHIADTVFRSGEAMKETQICLLSEGMTQIIKGWGVGFDWDSVRKRDRQG